MRKISVNNGRSYTTVEDAIAKVGIMTIAMMMDDDIRRDVDASFTGETDADFVRAYLSVAHDDLIIG